MKKYKRYFRKEIQGYAEVEAGSIDEANDRFDTEDFDNEQANSIVYDWEETIEIKH